MAPSRARAPLVSLVLFGVLLAGCASSPASSSDQGAVVGYSGGSLLAGPALWNDPQDAPHPAWGWATLSNPPVAGPGQGLPAWWTPITARALPSHIGGLDFVAQAANVTQGAGIAVFGKIAVVPEEGAYVHFVDLSDLAHPRQLSRLDSEGRGAAIVAYPNGKLVTAVSTGPGFDVIDFTKPTDPVLLTRVVVPVHGGHKLGIVPGTPILYNAGADGGNVFPGGVDPPVHGPGTCNVDVSQCKGGTEIYDLTNPKAPKLVQVFPNGLACHHIFFWNNATADDGHGAHGKFRAMCAGKEYTQIWDTADPLNPKVIVTLPVHSGIPGTPSVGASNVIFSHSAGLSADGKVLYVGDENFGGIGAAEVTESPGGCAAAEDTPLGRASAPVGAVWFYDVSDETHPRLLSEFSASEDENVDPSFTSCTAHHGRLVPDPEGRDLLAMSFYGAGVLLLDFTPVRDGGLATVVGSYRGERSDVWETWYDNGYLITGDLHRGLDVVTFS